MQSHLASVGVDGDVTGTALSEGVLEIAGPPAHVQHERPIQGVPRVDLRSGISGESPIEPIGVALLDEERREEPT
jgi:hypothetical protein